MAFKPIAVDTVKKYESEQFSFDEKGETLEGHLVDSVTLSKDGKSFQKYTVRVENGTHASTLGSYQLDQALSKVELGTLIRITYQGKKKLAGGKTVKLFAVESDTDNVIAVEPSSSTQSTAGPKSAKDAIAAMRAS